MEEERTMIPQDKTEREGRRVDERGRKEENVEGKSP